VARSDLLNCLHSLGELGAVACMVKSSVWSLLGRSGMSVTMSQLLLLQLTQRHGESEALALASVIKWLDSEAMTEQADKVIRVSDSLFGCNSSQWSHIIVDAKERVNLRRALARQNWTQVEKSLEKLRATKIKDQKVLKAEVLLKQGKTVESRDLLEQIISSTSPDARNAALRIRALILLSDVSNLSGSPVVGVQYLVEAIHTAGETGQDFLHHIASISLANCHLNMGFPAKALSLVMSHLPGILSHGGVVESAKAWLLLAKCKIAASKDCDKAQRRLQMLEGADLISKSKELFHSLNEFSRVLECLYLLARLYHNLQLTQERNTAASQFKKMEDLHPVKSRINMVVL